MLIDYNELNKKTIFDEYLSVQRLDCIFEMKQFETQLCKAIYTKLATVCIEFEH